MNEFSPWYAFKVRASLLLLLAAFSILTSCVQAQVYFPALGLLSWPLPQQDNAVTHYNRATGLLAKGDLDGAIAEFRMAISQQPNFPVAHFSLAVALEKKLDINSAIQELRTAISQQPNYPLAHNNLGDALARKGEVDSSIAELRTAISQQPNFKLAQNILNNTLETKSKSGAGPRQ